MFNGSCSSAYNIGAEAFAAARSGSAWRKATTMELSTSVGSSGVAAAGFYQAWFDAELRRNNGSFVTISDQVFLAPRPFFGTQLKNWVPFGCQLFRVTVCKQDNCVTLE